MMRESRVVVDDREVKTGISARALEDQGFQVEIRRLKVGDYLLDNQVLVERKTLMDLFQSIKDGRLFSQIGRLQETTCSHKALILEGTTGTFPHWRRRRDAVQGALITISFFYGLPVLRSRSTDETILLFRFITNQLAATRSGALPRQGQRPRGKRALQYHILQGLPRVGPDKARKLLEQFGTVEKVVQASDDDLQRIPGIGPTTARIIRWSLMETPSEYLASSADTPTANK